jgi:hypothetical protein
MTWGVFTFRERAMLYNALRDIEEIAYRVSENVRPEWKRIVADIATANDGRTWLRIYETPTHMNVVDALFSIRDLLKLVIEIDNEEKVSGINAWWIQAKEEKSEDSGQRE